MNVVPKNTEESSSEETQEVDQENIEQASSEETELGDSDAEEIPVVRSYVLVSYSSSTL